VDTQVRIGKDSLGKDSLGYSEARDDKKPKFKKPTVEEVAAYIKEKDFRINAEAFIDHYESNGWLVGKAKMKDWKAAVRNWERRRNNDEPDSKNTFDRAMEDFLKGGDDD
jgi:hypothetical protein